ncbi:MAG: HMA2 domain-containing protein [Magnetospirillum sp.]
MSAPEPALLRLLQVLSVAHHVPGRIRLKLSAPMGNELMALAEQAKAFGSAFSAMSGIRAVSLNPLAKSCTIEYDTNVIPATAWTGLLSGQITPGSEALRQGLVAAAQS